MTYLLIFILCLLTFVISQSDDEQIIYGYCGTQPTDTFTYLADAERPFCFKFKNANTGSDPYTSFYYFGSRVDLYTLITLSGSNLGEVPSSTAALNWRESADVGVQFEAGNLTTKTMWARKYDDDDAGKAWIFTQLSVVIILDQGQVSEVVWDTGCYACAEDHCIEDSCALTQDECTGSNTCDFSAYISWYGTDAKGRYLLSAGQRLSQFQQLSAESYYSYVKDKLDTDVIKFNQD